MELLQPVADLLGVTTTQILIVSGLFNVAVVGWYILKALLRITWKVFVTGVVLLVTLACGLGLVFIVLGGIG
ncbi:MAG: hypothetical protein ACFB51_14185 [Anaerolineae bacterium]